MKKILAGLFLVACAGLVTGCLLPARAYVGGDDGPVVEFGYTPILYSGYVVYYADGGVPFIWMNGAQYWIPAAERPYYVSHYQQHRSAYHTWYSHRKDTYRDRRYSKRRGDKRRAHGHDGRKHVSRPVLHPTSGHERRQEAAPKAKARRKHERKQHGEKQHGEKQHE